MEMVEVAKAVHEKGGGLVILLTVMICAIGGLYKLHTKRLDVIDTRLLDDEKGYYDLRERVKILEIKYGS